MKKIVFLILVITVITLVSCSNNNYDSDLNNNSLEQESLEPTITPSLVEPTPIITMRNNIHLSLKAVGNNYSMDGTDYLTKYPLIEKSKYKESIRIKINQIEEMMVRHPDVDIYTYFITKSENLNWFDKSEGIISFDYATYLNDNMPNGVKSGMLRFDSFDEFMELSYKTDHHWNHKGAYKGYTDIYNMISIDYELSEIQKPIKELEFNNLEWQGSKAKGAGVKVKPDVFIAYEYDLGNYKSYIGTELKTVGKEQEYKEGNINRDINVGQFDAYYSGGNEEKYVFEGNEYNMLFIADSNSKPIRPILASHFNTTLVIEHRSMDSLDIDEIIRSNKIDIVLIAAQINHWCDFFSNGKRYVFPGYPIELEFD